MKKVLLVLLLGSGSLSLATYGQAGLSEKAKQNLAANSAILKAYAAGDFTAVSKYIAADAVDHGGEMGDIKGVDSIVSEMKRYRAMMPDMKYQVVKELADDDYVFSWTKVEGTMNGQPMTMSGVDVSKFKDGKAVEHWTFMDPRDMMKMMPPPPAPQAPPPPPPKQ